MLLLECAAAVKDSLGHTVLNNVVISPLNKVGPVSCAAAHRDLGRLTNEMLCRLLIARESKGFLYSQSKLQALAPMLRDEAALLLSVALIRAADHQGGPEATERTLSK